MKDFPLISPCDYTLTHYIGFIQLIINNEEHEYPIEIKLKDPSNIRTASLYSDKLSHLLEENKNIISQMLQSSSDLNTFLVDLKDLLVIQLNSFYCVIF